MMRTFVPFPVLRKFQLTAGRGTGMVVPTTRDVRIYGTQPHDVLLWPEWNLLLSKPASAPRQLKVARLHNRRLFYRGNAGEFNTNPKKKATYRHE